MEEKLGKDYELVLVLDPEQEDSGVADTLVRVRKVIEDNGGSVVEEDRQGMRKVAYPINKTRQGNYIVSQLQMSPESTAELNSSLNLTEAVMRHIIIKKSIKKSRQQGLVRDGWFKQNNGYWHAWS